jgi:hypothetical protein
MNNNIVRLMPPSSDNSSKPHQDHKWIGRIAIFELVTGSRVQGKILAINDQVIDTDNGAIWVQHIVSAKWVGQEEAAIIRGGPMQPWDPSRQLR